MIGYFTINRFLFSVALTVLFSFQALAGNENMSNRITGTEITEDEAVLTVADQFFPDIEDGCRVKQANGRVILGVDHSVSGPVSLFSVKLTVHYSDRAGNFAVMADQWLTVDASRDRDVLFFPDAVYISVDIEDISGAVPDYVFIQGEIETERYYDLNRTLIPFSNGGMEHSLTTSNELEIFWNYIPGAEEYELEYTYIDNYDSDGSEIAAASLNWSFEFNSTRIRLVDNYYKFPLLYDRGYILYRVRPIGRGGVELNKDVFGRWSSDQFSGTLVSTFLHKYQITGFQNLNYQLGITFSENGKRKDIVNYFDGSLRGRQTLTRSNSNEKIIIADKIYDYEGRPAITTLPAPVADPNAPKTLDFHPKFTTNTTGDKYGQEDFDTGEGCDANAAPMNTENGAALYYSPDNPVNTGHHAYIPDAEGYPFSQTEYEPDNTGRIRRQGGVGPVFQPKGNGTGRETRYYYGQPEQEQLDRLFGNDVGYAGYYKKNMVMDANRQVSVSYLDQTGKVVATALAGESPANMETTNDAPLSSVSIVAIDECPEGNGCNKNNTRTDNALVFTKKLLVSSAGDYVFNYEITPEEVSACNNVCYDCVYRLQMSITDECGELVKISSSSSQPINAVNEVVGTIGSLTCDGSAPKHTQTPISCYLPVGSYTLTKTLAVDPEKMEDYVEQRVTTCLKTIEDFETEERAKVDFENACEEVDCMNCLTSLHYERGRSLKDNYTDYSGNSQFEYTLSEEEYKGAVETCMELCSEISNCQASYNMMLSDFAPGGQYAATDNTSEHWELSVFNPDNKLPRNRVGTSAVIPSWRTPESEYKDENGYTAYIELTPLGIDDILENYLINGDKSGFGSIGAGNFRPALLAVENFDFENYVLRGYYDSNNKFKEDKQKGDVLVTLPENLASAEDFRTYWQPQWAKELVQYHPEYCYYEYCSLTDSYKFNNATYTSDQFDQRLHLIETFADASRKIDSGDLNDPWFNDGPLIDPLASVVTDLLDKDPYFTNQPALKTEMQTRLEEYKESEGQTLNIKEFVAMTVRCGSIYYFNGSGDPAYSGCKAFGSGSSSEIRDQEWEMYKMLYLSEKQKIWQREADKACMPSIGNPAFVGGINTCIGKDDFRPFDWRYSYRSGSNNREFWAWIACEQYFYCQPCGSTSYALYKNKTLRFTRHETQEEMLDICDAGDLTDAGRIVQGQQKADLEHFLATGQCPATRDFGALLNQLAERGTLLTDNTNLRSYSALSKDLYDRIVFAGVPQPAFTTLYKEPMWRVNTPPSTTQRIFRITEGANERVFCSIIITPGQHISYIDPVDNQIYRIPVTFDEDDNFAEYQPYPVNVSDPFDTESGSSRFRLRITGIRNFFVTRMETHPSLFNDFIANAIIEVYDKTGPEDVLLHTEYSIRLTGIVFNVQLNDCNFDRVCTLSKGAKDLQNLLSGIAANEDNHFSTAIPVSLTSSNYAPLFTTPLQYFANCSNAASLTFTSAISSRVATISFSGTGNIVLTPLDGTFTDEDYAKIISFSCIQSDESTPELNDFLITALVEKEVVTPLGGGFSPLSFNVEDPSFELVPVQFKGTFRSCDTTGRSFRVNECGAPVPEKCKGIEYENARILPVFFDQLIRANGFKANEVINLSSIEGFLPLKDQLGTGDYTWHNVLIDNNTLSADICELDINDNCIGESYSVTVEATGFPSGAGFDKLTGLTTLVEVDHSAKEDDNKYYSADLMGLIIGHESIANSTVRLKVKTIFPLENCISECAAGKTNLIPNGDFDDPTVPYVLGSGNNTVCYFTRTSWCSDYWANLQNSINVGEIRIVTNGRIANPSPLGPWHEIRDFPDGNGFFLAADGSGTRSIWYTDVFVESGKSYDFSVFASNLYGTPPGVVLYVHDNNGDNVVGELIDVPNDMTWHNVRGLYYATNTGSVRVGIRLLDRSSSWGNDVGIDHISFSEICSFPIMPTVEVEIYNPCEDHLNSLVDLNAQNAYKTYVDKHRNDFRQEYLDKCLSAGEKLSYDYEEKEHQYTLYYYDQAGNLVKTVPPAGVTALGNTAISQIRKDRISNTHTLNLQPEHRMATTYGYNSLNQLISQSLPDHVPMDVWESQDASSGIPAGYTVRDVQFADASRGWAIAVDEYDPERRGRLVTTSDGGNNWNELSKVGITGISAVHFVDNDYAYAVGSKGDLLYSSDGGLTWLTLRTPSDKPLIGLYFDSAFPEEGRIYAADGKMYITTNAGRTWSSAYTGFSSMLSGELKSISFTDDGTAGTAVSVDGEQTYVYQGSNNGETWTKITDFATAPYNTLHMSSASNGYIGGDKGILLRTTDGGENWTLVSNNLTLDIRRLHFANQVTGAAILSDKKLYVTSNKGQTWQRETMDLPAGENFVDMYSAGTSDVYLLSENGNVYKSVSGGLTWELYTQVSPGGSALHSLSVRPGSGSVYTGGEDGKIWNNEGLLAGSRPGNGTILDMHFTELDEGCIIVQSGSGSLIYYSDNANVTEAVWTNVTPAGAGNVREFHFISPDNGYAYTSSGKILKTTNGGISWTEMTALPAHAGIRTFYMTGSDQGIVAGDNSGTGFIEKCISTWEDKPVTSVSGRLHATFTAGTSVAYAVGDNGLVLRKKSTSQWAVDVPAQKGSLHAVTGAVVSSQFEGLAAGDNGYNLQISGAGLTVGTTTGISSGTDFRGLSLSGSNTYYAAGKGGALYRFASGNWTAQTCSPQACPAHDLKAIDFAASDRGLAVGASGTIVRFNGTAWTSINEMTTPELNETCIVPGSTSTGFAVGNGGTILMTEDGGTSWKAKNSGTTTDLHGIAFASADNGLAVGLDGLVLRTINGGQNWTKVASVTVTTGLHAVAVSGQTAVAVGSSGTIIRSADGGATWTNETLSGTGHLRAVFMVDASTAYAVGDAGAMIRTRDGGNNWTSMTKGSGSERWTMENLYDVYFATALNGYVVGANGTFLKTINKGDTWHDQDSKVPFGVDLQAIVGRGSNASIYTGGAGTMRALTDMADRISGRFWYDELGRLVASQNTRQLKNNQYSYTVYDAQSRITEVGQAEQLVSPSVDNQVAYTIFTDWLANSTKTEITKTCYDKKLEDIAGFRQDNLRTRVATVTYQDEDNALYNGKTYQYATHYSYDPHGNVKSLIQENYQLSDLQQEFKRIDYSYDLVSGLVKEVAYQKGKADQFFHRYTYDADNRITEVHTSANGVLWDQDAKYFYYDHGPLARTEVGELSVQGMDYAYTLQGWIKGINSNILQANRDMGKDSRSGVNAVFAPDEFSYSLGYYDQDYKAINSSGSMHFLAGTPQNGFSGSSASLYNGNISHMVTAIGRLMADGPQAYAYSYDQLNRLRTVTAHLDPNVMVVNSWKSGSGIQDYSEDYQYDLNGNILRVKRNAAGAEANSSGTGMDDLEYVYENIANEYKRETNKLRQVIDHQTGSSLSEDFKPGQSPDNYDYDEIGNLIADEQEKIENIEWTVSGKIRKVTRKEEAGVSKPDLEFAYDASGNRIMKLEKPRVDGDLLPEHAWSYTYYVRDASGNVMRTYTKKYTEESSGYAVAYKATEAPVYGSSRLGLQTLRADEMLASRPFTATLSSGRFSGISYTADPAIEPASLSHMYSLRGVKQYELNDHLGNVKVVVSDQRVLPGSSTEFTFTSGYEGDDYNVWNDKGNYSAHQSTEHARTGTSSLKLRYDEPAGVLQGPELKITVEPGDIIDLEVYTLWEAGPGTKPGAVDFKIVNGNGFNYNHLRTTQSSSTANVWYRSSIEDFEVMAKPPGVDQLYLIVRPAVYSNEYITWFDDMKLTVRSGSEESSRTADVKSYSDYYAFGMQMPGRYANDGYRYGFNGKERDSEGMGGGGSTYDYGFRIYNPQIGKFLSVDPLTAKFPFYTPYQFAGDKPIVALDLDGREDIWIHQITNQDTRKIITETREVDDAVKKVLVSYLGYDPDAYNEGGVLVTSAETKNGETYTTGHHMTMPIVVKGERSNESATFDSFERWFYTNAKGNSDNEMEAPFKSAGVGVDVESKINGTSKVRHSVKLLGNTEEDLYLQVSTSYIIEASAKKKFDVSLPTDNNRTEVFGYFSLNFSSKVSEGFSVGQNLEDVTTMRASWLKGSYNHRSGELKVGLSTSRKFEVGHSFRNSNTVGYTTGNLGE